MQMRCLTLIVTGSLVSMTGLFGIWPLLGWNSVGVPAGSDLRSTSESFEITGIRVPRGYVTDATLQTVARHQNLDTLDLSGCSISQKQYEWLADLRALRVLSLRGTRIRDSGFAHLERLQALEELDLDYVEITDKSLAAVGS